MKEHFHHRKFNFNKLCTSANGVAVSLHPPKVQTRVRLPVGAQCSVDGNFRSLKDNVEVIDLTENEPWLYDCTK